MHASQGKWHRAKHLTYLADRLMALQRGEIKRLAVSMPPRHGKSEFISKYFPSWYLGAHPENRVVLTSYGADLTKQWGRAARDMFAEHAPSVFGYDTWQRAKATDWHVYRDGRPTGGGFFSCGRGGALTGRGADLLVVDDPVKDAAEANSPTVREHMWEWLRSVPFTRLEPDGKVVIVQTRWHYDDPIGRIIEQQERGDAGEQWEIINFPAIAIEDDILGRAPGDVLWPERFDRESLDVIRRDVGPYVWQSLYQGAPTPTVGGLFKRTWFKYADVTDSHLRIKTPTGQTTRLRRDLVYFSTNDLAVSAKRYADFSAMAVWAADVSNAELFLLHIHRGRMEAPELLKAWERQREYWNLPAIYVEKTAFNLQFCQMARASGLPIRWLKADKDKVSRAQPAVAMYEGGRIFHAAGEPWLPALESELLRFPAGKHDDMADVVSYGVRVFLNLLRSYRRSSAASSLGNRLILSEAV